MTILHPTLRLTVGIALSLPALLWVAPASAHVTVQPSEATQGSYTKITFRVPDESDTAATSKVEVGFPSDQPITSVRTKQVPGWKAEVAMATPSVPLEGADGPITEVVGSVSWTATDPDAAIQPGEFGEFDLSVGPLPSSDSVVFKAVQTYTDGTVVRWIDEADSHGEADYPAPVLTLVAGSGSDAHGHSAGSDSTEKSDETDTNGGHAAPSDNTSSTPMVLSVAALVVAFGAGALAAFGLRRRR